MNAAGCGSVCSRDMAVLIAAAATESSQDRFSISGNLAMLAATHRASSRVSGMDAARRDTQLSVIGRESEVRDLRLKRR
jgi:hypothetical protein